MSKLLKELEGKDLSLIDACKIINELTNQLKEVSNLLKTSCEFDEAHEVNNMDEIEPEYQRYASLKNWLNNNPI